MTDLEAQKLAVELTVADDGLDAAEQHIKQRYPDEDAQRLELLSHARQYADERQEVEAQ